LGVRFRKVGFSKLSEDMPVPVGKYAMAKGIALAEYQPGETGEQ
jgi:hypothetical protein